MTRCYSVLATAQKPLLSESLATEERVFFRRVSFVCFSFLASTISHGLRS